MTAISRMNKAQLRSLAEDLMTTDKIKSAEIVMLKELNAGQAQANWDMWESNTRLMGENSRLRHIEQQLHFMVGAMLLVGVVIGAVTMAFIGEWR